MLRLFLCFMYCLSFHGQHEPHEPGEADPANDPLRRVQDEESINIASSEFGHDGVEGILTSDNTRKDVRTLSSVAVGQKLTNGLSERIPDTTFDETTNVGFGDESDHLALAICDGNSAAFVAGEDTQNLDERRFQRHIAHGSSHLTKGEKKEMGTKTATSGSWRRPASDTLMPKTAAR